MVPKLKRTLYIGLGGTGFKTLLHTKRAFIETYGEVPPMIKFLAFDSDQNQYKTYALDSIYGAIKFDPSESSSISVDQAEEITSRHREELSWLPDRNLSAVVDLVNGCGMVRTNGRFAFSYNYIKSKSNIKRALDQICNLQTVHNAKYDLLSNDVEVNIVFSIAGGTGSGTFLDMAYLVKNIFREKALPKTSKVIGYMVLPDVYDAQLVHGKERLFPNACGSLVDLDYMMSSQFDREIPVDYFGVHTSLVGAPFNTVFAINNKNLNGDVVNHINDLAQMMSMAMVVTAGELSSGMSSIANNIEKDIHSTTYDINGKRAVMASLGMSEITFRASELSALYQEKAAREIAAALLNPGSNVDIEANTWIDTEQIRENNGMDQVIDFLLPKRPTLIIQEIYDKTNPMADIRNYRILDGVDVKTEYLTKKVEELKSRIKKSFESKTRSIVNSKGPVYAKEFIDQLKTQIEICLDEMRKELSDCQAAITAKDSAIKTAVEEYKEANKKWIGKNKAVQEAAETLCAVVNDAVINDREIHRRNGAITFYTWLLNEMANAKQKLQNIEANIKEACMILRSKIATTTSNLMSPRGLFEIDLTKPYVEKVEVLPSSINVNQYTQALPTGVEIYNFDILAPTAIAESMLKYSATLSSGGEWEAMSVEDALAKLPKEEVENIIHLAIKLSSPMCPLNHRGEIPKPLFNYYFIGVQEQSSTGLKGSIIDFKQCISASENHGCDYASIGSRDRIVLYHAYSVFPTFVMASTMAYRNEHDRYMSNPNAYSCFRDEDLRITMEREGFSVLPKKRTDNSLELWVKGLIFGLINRDESGVYRYKDETNDDMALFGYWTSLATPYRDEAFKKFKLVAEKLQPQYESYMNNRAKAEGHDAIEAIIADAKNNYLEKYSLNDLSERDFTNSLYRGIVKQLTDEVNFVRDM